MKLCCSTKNDTDFQEGLLVLTDFNDYCSSARINIAFIKNHSVQNKLVPPKLLSTCSLRARHFPSVLVTWLDKDGALTYCPYGHSNRSGSWGGPGGSRTWAPFPPAELDTPVGQVTSPKGCGVLIGWLHALGGRAGTVSIYREASMVTLARSGKERERKRKKVWQDHCPLVWYLF